MDPMFGRHLFQVFAARHFGVRRLLCKWLYIFMFAGLVTQNLSAQEDAAGGNELLLPGYSFRQYAELEASMGSQAFELFSMGYADGVAHGWIFMEIGKYLNPQNSGGLSRAEIVRAMNEVSACVVDLNPEFWPDYLKAQSQLKSSTSRVSAAIIEFLTNHCWRDQTRNQILEQLPGR